MDYYKKKLKITFQGFFNMMSDLGKCWKMLAIFDKDS